VLLGKGVPLPCKTGFFFPIIIHSFPGWNRFLSGFMAEILAN